MAPRVPDAQGQYLCVGCRRRLPRAEFRTLHGATGARVDSYCGECRNTRRKRDRVRAALRDPSGPEKRLRRQGAARRRQAAKELAERRADAQVAYLWLTTHGWTIHRLAATLHMSRRTLCRIRDGGGAVRHDVVRRLWALYLSEVSLGEYEL